MSFETSASERGLGRFVLWLELDKRDVLLVEALVTHPLGVHLLGQQLEGRLRQTRADAVVPEVAARLTEKGLRG